METYDLGQAVLLAHAGRQDVGGIVGAFSTSTGTFYDVELEGKIVKGVLADELEPATPETISLVLQTVLSRTMQPSGDQGTSIRAQYLRSRYVMLLRELLSHGEDVQDSMASMPIFSVQQDVALRRDDAWLLATVVGVRSRADDVLYDLDVAGTYVRVPQGELCAMGEVPVTGEHSLGARVRYVASGYEDDEAFLATVCAIRGESGAIAYDIVFDDGDVFENVGPTDLAPV